MSRRSSGAIDKSARPKGARCAIYTRKSTEEGLDQEFNSLDAQREACAAYITSQRHEGWVLLPDYYDDGGFSGGNMDRPGLRQLLTDVEAGKIDVIVVYKVDRLTRSLSDFAKIVDVLDAKGASFVSITQSFNTTTSMGRLTLNVLLSFAQFEREVISERVRDKIAASKRKGMWMGGRVAFGYDVRERKLIVNEAEAEVVRHIMRRYLELGSVRDLQSALAKEGIVSKALICRNGRCLGGGAFGRGALYHLLSNRLYLGEIVHRGSIYDGEHAGIVPRELWDQVQQLLDSNGVDRRCGTTADNPSLLAGMIRDDEGRRMTPSHAAKGPLRYRYYVSVVEHEHGKATATPARRIAAGDLEGAIVFALRNLFDDQSRMVGILEGAIGDSRAATRVSSAARSLAKSIPDLSTSELRALALALDLRVTINREGVDANIGRAALASRLGAPTEVPAGRDDHLALEVRAIIIRRGHEMRLAVQPKNSSGMVRRDGRLLALIVKANDARRMLIMKGEAMSAEEGGAYSQKHLARMARLSFLAPDIVAAITDGRQPATLTARRLLRAPEIPMAWEEQRRIFGFS